MLEVRMRKSEQEGGALIELSLVLPVMILLLVGIIEYGKSFSQAFWIAQASYNSVLKGGEVPLGGTKREDKMRERFDKSLIIHRNNFVAGENMDVVPNVDPAIMDEALQATVEGTVSTDSFNILPLEVPVRVRIIAPVVIMGGNTAVSGYDKFGNPQDLHTCDSSPGTCSTASLCATAHPDSTDCGNWIE
jgi:hypothetical protein